MSNSQLAKITHILLLRKTKMSNLCGVGKCTEKNTPKGKMGYPKRQNGISQMVVWGMINGDSGHRDKGAEVEFWVSRAEKWGGMRPRYTPKIG